MNLVSNRINKFLVFVCLVLVLCTCGAASDYVEKKDHLNGKTTSLMPNEIRSTRMSLITSIDLSIDEISQDGNGYAANIVDKCTIGEILCQKEIDSGDTIICYWEKDHLSNPHNKYRKYWGIDQGTTVLQFCMEDSGYEAGYDVVPFSNILGKTGFCIIAPRGAAYVAHDYYCLADDGTPYLLTGCANEVITRDFNHDGTSELIWLYHGGAQSYYCYSKADAVYQVDIPQAIGGANFELTWGKAYTEPFESEDGIFLAVKFFDENKNEVICYLGFDSEQINIFQLN